MKIGFNNAKKFGNLIPSIKKIEPINYYLNLRKIIKLFIFKKTLMKMKPMMLLFATINNLNLF